MSSRRRGASGRSSSRRDRYGIQTEEEKFDNEVADGYSSSVSRLVANFQGGSAPTPTGGLDPILATPAARHANQEKVSSLNRPGNDDDNNNNEDDDDDDNGDEYAPLSPTRSNGNDQNDIFRDEPDGDDEDDDEDDIDYEMTLQELLYSTSSFNAIVAPGRSKMGWCVVQQTTNVVLPDAINGQIKNNKLTRPFPPCCSRHYYDLVGLGGCVRQ